MFAHDTNVFLSVINVDYFFSDLMEYLYSLKQMNYR